LLEIDLKILLGKQEKTALLSLHIDPEIDGAYISWEVF
jgi:hypothetical protein